MRFTKKSNINFEQKIKIHQGFTLAEVLITIGIIGIVAALTIPSLIANYQNQQHLTQLKKVYTQVNQTLLKIAADYDCPGDLKCTGLFASAGPAGTNVFGPVFASHFKKAKVCGGSDNLGCFPASANYKYNGAGTADTTLDTGWEYKFITTDGASLKIAAASTAECGWNGSSGYNLAMSQVCGSLKVDVNGPTKPPNRWGKDIFLYFITNGKGPMLYPIGGLDDGNSGKWWNSGTSGCHSAATQNTMCAARILEEGWKINY